MPSLSLFALHILESVNPRIHDIVERHAGLHLALGELVVFLVTLSDALSVHVVKGEAVGSLGNLDKCRLGNGRLRERNGVNSGPIGGRGEQTNGNKSVHDVSSELWR